MVRAFSLCLTGYLAGCTQTQETERGAEEQVASNVIPMGANAKFDSALIPRSVLNVSPEHFAVSINRVGDKISYFARKGNEVELRIENLSGKLLRAFPINELKGERIGFYTWAFTGEHILMEQNQGGDENDHIMCLNITTGQKRDLTPFRGAKSGIIRMSKKYPEEIIVVSNKRDPKWMDAYKINIVTGKTELIFKNDRYLSLVFDKDFRIRAAVTTIMTPGGKQELHWFKGGKPILFKKYSYEDSQSSTMPYFSSDGKTVYMLESANRDKNVLLEYRVSDIDSFVSYPISKRPKNLKLAKILFQNNLADIDYVVFDHKTLHPQAVIVDYLKPEIFVIGKSIEKDIQYLKQQSKGKIFDIVSCNDDDDTWIICYRSAMTPMEYYIYKRDPKTGSPISLKFLFVSKKALKQYKLQDKEPIVIKSRDGLNLVCYLTKSADFKTATKKKLVVLVHGGPWSRDYYDCEVSVQLLANRGYSVLQINYRGSTGFGKKFANAINGNLFGVQHDIIDGVNWAIEHKIADKDSIAIMGASFGGYATLSGLEGSPDVFCCGVDCCGISNWNTFFNSVPAYWQPVMFTYYKLFGKEEKGKYKIVSELSPIYHASRIKKPLIVFQGRNDPRVNKAEADQIVKALKKENIPVAYVLFQDEGHGFEREPNYKAFAAFTEVFLAKALGGRYEPIHPGELKDSSYKILEGEDLLRGK
jgi:dipeptidyl aminopeptidase/acylaminoacyl peptidase